MAGPTTHHCPMMSLGGCRARVDIPGGKKDYCPTHQTYCRVCLHPHLQDEQCGECAKTAKFKAAQLAKVERAAKDKKRKEEEMNKPVIKGDSNRKNWKPSTKEDKSKTNVKSNGAKSREEDSKNNNKGKK